MFFTQSAVESGRQVVISGEVISTGMSEVFEVEVEHTLDSTEVIVKVVVPVVAREIVLNDPLPELKFIVVV
jgi:hypothetical protein